MRGNAGTIGVDEAESSLALWVEIAGGFEVATPSVRQVGSSLMVSRIYSQLNKRNILSCSGMSADIQMLGSHRDSQELCLDESVSYLQPTKPNPEIVISDRFCLKPAGIGNKGKEWTNK